MRNYEFHKKYFALLNYAYEMWSPIEADGIQKSFDVFRKEITILAGFYTSNFSIDGSVQLQAQSVSFAKMSEEQFHDLYSKTLSVIVNHVLDSYTEESLATVMEELTKYEG